MCSSCVCRKTQGDTIICDQLQQQSYLHLDNCMTSNSSYLSVQGSDGISFGCPYVHYSNIVNHIHSSST